MFRPTLHLQALNLSTFSLLALIVRVVEKVIEAYTSRPERPFFYREKRVVDSRMEGGAYLNTQMDLEGVDVVRG